MGLHRFAFDWPRASGCFHDSDSHSLYLLCSVLCEAQSDFLRVQLDDDDDDDEAPSGRVGGRGGGGRGRGGRGGRGGGRGAGGEQECKQQ